MLFLGQAWEPADQLAVAAYEPATNRDKTGTDSERHHQFHVFRLAAANVLFCRSPDAHDRVRSHLAD